MSNERMGHRWPQQGRLPASFPLTSSIVRLVMGHPRKCVPCVRIWSRMDLSFTVTASVGSQIDESFQLCPLGFSEEWLDVKMVDLSAVSICLTVKSGDEVVGFTAVVANELKELQGTFHKPLLSASGVVGEIVLDFTVVTNLEIASNARPEKGISDANPPRLVGHRGSGKHGTTPFKENTVLSFIAATRTAAVSHVELDVQLTREGTPVVYHDFHVTPKRRGSKQEYCIPIYALSIEEWKTLQPPGLHEDDGYGSDDASPATSLSRRKKTPSNDRKAKEFDGFIEDVLPTLANVCKECPTDVGMMIELKYPVEEFQQMMNLPFPTRDFFANRVLEAVFSEPKNFQRSITFLTFDADLAIALKAKQVRFPVYFLCCEKNGEPVDLFDSRCVLGENAVDFACAAGLDGNVFSTDVLLAKPFLVERAKAKDLKVMTYGTSNSVAEIVKNQFDLGVDGVIADNVNLLATQLDMKTDPLRVQPTSDVFFSRCIGNLTPDEVSTSFEKVST